MSTLFAFLHHLCAFTLVACVTIEFTLIRQELTLASARRLQVTDLVLGIAAGLLLVIGLLRVFFFEKGPAYYWHSHAFLTKFSLFIIIGLLSIIPTMEFLSWRGAIAAGAGDGRGQAQARHHDPSHRACGDRAHPALRRHHGTGRMGVGRASCIGRISDCVRRSSTSEGGSVIRRPS